MARKAGTGSRPSTGSASRPISESRARKATTGLRTSTGSALRVGKATSRSSTNGGVKGGDSGIEGGDGGEAEHWVEGEECDVEGGNDIGVGVEAGKRRQWWRRGWD
jgi:hypothetical protein